MKMNISKLLGLAAVAGFLAVAAPSGSQALSLAGPGSAATAQHASEGVVNEARWHRRRGGWGRHHGWRPHRYHRRHRWY